MGRHTRIARRRLPHAQDRHIYLPHPSWGAPARPSVDTPARKVSADDFWSMLGV